MRIFRHRQTYLVNVNSHAHVCPKRQATGWCQYVRCIGQLRSICHWLVGQASPLCAIGVGVRVWRAVLCSRRYDPRNAGKGFVPTSTLGKSGQGHAKPLPFAWAEMSRQTPSSAAGHQQGVGWAPTYLWLAEMLHVLQSGSGKL